LSLIAFWANQNEQHTENYQKHVTKIHTDNLKEAQILALKRTAITRFGVFDWLAYASTLSGAVVRDHNFELVASIKT